MLIRTLLRVVSAIILLLAGFMAGWYGAIMLVPGSASQSGPAAVREQFGVFWEVWDLVENEYYGRAALDQTKMIQGAIKGMLSGIGDQYSVYQEPDLAAQTQDHMQGKLGGIGSYLRITDGRAFLYKPFKSGPAYQAGLRQDDELIKIDGADVPPLITGLDVSAASVKIAALLRGPENTQVALVIRNASGALTNITLTRRDIVVPSVEAQRFDGGIVYLRVSEFKGNTTKEFDDALRELLTNRPRGIILDLRNNPGGLLGSAQDMLGRFYRGVALYEQDGIGGEKELRTNGNPSIPDVPLIVLVNNGSASASEIVAGALLDRRPSTTLLGEKTFGKGSVQNVHTLRDGGSARITFAHWVTPDHHAIHAVGLTPQYIVPFADDPNSRVPCVADRQPTPGQSLCGDTQLAQAIRLLQP
ncbi:MAG: S41 family peptidase [Roseiflexaceae bacterium]|nr:S41 family peptidase [Roseiflexaceae bacterium]